MPFIDRADTLFSELPIAPRPEVEPVEEARPDASAVLGAGFRQNNIVSSLYERLTTEGLDTFTTPPRVEDYDPFTDISGFEDYAARFVRSGSPAETLRIKERIRSERTDRDILRRAGGWGVASSIAGGVIDPVTIGSMIIPVAPALAGASRGTRIAAGVGGQIAFDSTVEATLHSAQELRTPQESAFNVGAGALLVGALGTVATRVPKKDLDKARAELREDLRAAVNTEGSTVGAAARGTETTLADEGIAKGGQALAATMGKVSPVTRVLQAPVKSARILAQRLVDVPYVLGKHLKGIAGHRSVEGMVKRLVNIGRWQTVKLTDEAFVEYKQAGGTLSRKQFSREVSNALTRGDVSDVPQVMKVVSWARETFEADKKLLRELGIEIDDTVIGAKSYFPRVYDFAKIIANRADFENRLFRWFKDNPKVPEEGDVLAEVESRLHNAVARRNEMRVQGISDDAAPAVALDLEIQAARQALTSKRAKVSAVQASGTTRVKANQILAEEEAQQAAREVEQQLSEVATLQESAASATKEARTANRRVSRIKRQANVLASRIRVLSRQLADMNTDAPKRSVTDIELQLSKTQKVLAEKRQALAAAVKARKGTTGEARKAAERAVAAARSERDEISKEVFSLRSERNLARQAGDPVEAFGRLDARIARLQAKLDKTRLSAYDARAVAHQFRQIARGVLKEFKDQSAKLAAKKDVAKGAKTRAAKAVPAPKDDAEIRDEVQNVFDHIMGMPSSKAELSLHSKAAPLKSRVLDVPDDILEPFMVRDFETVMAAYFRSMAPEIAMRKTFGSTDLKNEIDEITQEFRIKIEAAKDNAAKEVLRKQEEAAINDIVLLRDRLLGDVGPRGAQHANWIRAARIARLYNYTRLLGSQMLSSIPDYGRLVARYGLARTLTRTASFLTNWNLNKLSRADAHRMGTALEVAVDTRSAQIGDIAEELPTTRFDQGMHWIGNTFSRVSLMSPWNATMKTLTVVLEQDSLIRALQKGKLSKFQTAQLARAGIGEEEGKRILKMFAKHGEEVGGTLRARTELWEDQEAARLVEESILKVADEMIVTRGVGDLPRMMDNELAKTLLQFKSFAISSVNRTMIPLAQGLAHADAKSAQGLASMLALGMFTYYAKEFAAGREPDTSPDRLVAEALNWSGTLGYLPEIWDPVASMHEALPRFSRFQSRSPMESLAGPTFGTTIDTTAGTIRGLIDGEVTQQDVARFRRLLPMQSLFYGRRMFNAIEGEVGEAFNAEGSTVRTFGERIAEETPTK